MGQLQVRCGTAPYRGRSIHVLSPTEPHNLVAIQRDRDRVAVFADADGMEYLARLLWLAASERDSVVFLPAQGKVPTRWEHLNGMPCDLVLCHRTLQLRPSSWKAMRRYLRPDAISEATFPKMSRDEHYPSHGKDWTDIITHGRTGFVVADRETFEFLATSCADLAETGVEDNGISCGRHDDEAFEIIKIRASTPKRALRVLSDTVPFRRTSVPVFCPSEPKGKIFASGQNDGALLIYADDEGLTRLADLFLLASSQKEALLYLPSSRELAPWLPSSQYEAYDLVFGHPSRQFRTSVWRDARAYLGGKKVQTLGLPEPKPIDPYNPAKMDIFIHGRTGFIIAPRPVFEMLAYTCLGIRGKVHQGFYCEGMGRHDPTALHILRMKT